MRFLLGSVLLIGCVPTHPVEAHRWPTHELIEAAEEHEVYGGFPPGFFVTLGGAPMPFRGPDYQSPAAIAVADGWSVLPAYAQSQPAAYVVSELWENHPDPWVQPVYALVTGFDPVARQTVDGVLVPNVFGVGDHSTFYSPYWQAVLVSTKEPAPKEGLPDTRAVLAAATEIRLAAKPLCPVTPDGFMIATEGGGPVHPFTGAPIKQRNAGPVRIDGATESYIDFGPDRFSSTASGLVRPTRIFFFSRMIGGERTLLELPAVLASNAVRSAYARRHDLVLENEVVFVPPGPKWDTIRQRLNAPAVDPGISPALASAYALRVAKSGDCFAAAAIFPAGCQWIDSEAAIDQLGARRLVRTEVTMTAVPMLFAGEQL